MPSIRDEGQRVNAEEKDSDFILRLLVGLQGIEDILLLERGVAQDHPGQHA
jgi:hypothetical protein